MNMTYPALRVRSDYTLGRGASMTKDLVNTAARLGMPALALTDENGLHGAFGFSLEAMAAGVQPLLGVEVQVEVEGVTGWVLLLAQNDIGYINISRVVEHLYQPRKTTKGRVTTDVVDISRPLDFETLSNLSEGVILLTGDRNRGLLPKLATSGQGALEAMFRTVRPLLRTFGDRLYIEVFRTRRSDASTPLEANLLDCAYGGAGDVVCSDGQTRSQIPLVATTDVWYDRPERHLAWVLMSAQAESSPVILENGALEKDDGIRHCLKDMADMDALFADMPEALQNTFSIARRCHYATAARKPILPPFHTTSGRNENDELVHMSNVGLQVRLDVMEADAATREAYQKRLDFELGVIIKMGFPGYFLIVADFIQWAKAQEIPVGPGRGSGAGSLVAFALTITNVDPIRWGLLFERFLNPDRVSMPDFDIDFCIERRDEVIDYVRRRYGDSNVSMISTFGRIMARAAIRDVQRILVDRVVGSFTFGDSADILSLMPNTPADQKKTLAEHEQDNPALSELLSRKPKLRILYDAARQIEGLRRNLSTHAAGVIIADRPLAELFPVVRDVKTLVPVSAYSMKYSEMAGAVKFDFLGLKNLTIIDKAVRNIRHFMGQVIDIDRIPLDDPEVFPWFSEGRTTGVFQFSGAGIRNALRQIKPTSVDDLTAVNALYRPGPMQYIPTFAHRKMGIGMSDDVYPEPVARTKEFLQETYGLMVYQEQVMMVARVCAGYSLGAADLLRRAMGKKQADEMIRQKEIFLHGSAEAGIPGAVALGMDETKASTLFDDILKFADYGFNKSHALAYSLLAYANLWLKVHYPACYYAALLTYTARPEERSLVKEEMDEIGLKLLPPDINSSDLAFVPERLEDGTLAVRFGLSAIAKVSESAMGFITERKSNGPYADLPAFFSRCRDLVNSGAVESLITAGAFDCINANRAAVSAGMKWMFSGKAAKVPVTQTDFFGSIAPIVLPDYDPKTKVPVMATGEWADRAAREFASARFYFSGHPIQTRKSRLPKLGVKRRVSYRLYMKSARAAELQNRRLCVMVDRVDRLTTRNNTPYLSASVAEEQDHYTIRFFEPRTRRFAQKEDPFTDMPLEDIYNVLTTAARELTPVVVLGRLVYDETFGVNVTGRAVMLADDYLRGVRTDHTLVLTGAEGIEMVVAGVRAMLGRVRTDGEHDSIVRIEAADGSLVAELPGRYAVDDMHIKAFRSMGGIAYTYEPMDKTDRGEIDSELAGYDASSADEGGEVEEMED